MPKQINVLAGTSNPGNTNAVLPVLKILQEQGANVFAIGEYDENPPRFPSAKTFTENEFITFALKTEDIRRYDPRRFLFLAENSDLIITSTSRPAKKLPKEEYSIDQMLVMAGFEIGKPVLVVEDIWGAYQPLSKNESPAVTVIDTPSIEILKRNAPNIQQFFVTGNPAFDKYASLNVPDERAKLRKELGIENKFLIAYAGQVTPNNPESLSWIVESLRDNDMLYFGRHPRDNRAYADILGKAQSKLLTVENRSFDSLIPAADLVVTHYSTVGLTAALLGVDVMNLNVEGDAPPYDGMVMPNEYPLVISGASIGVSSRQEFKEKLNDIESLKPGLDKGRNENYANDGKSAERVADAAYKLIGQSRI